MRLADINEGCACGLAALLGADAEIGGAMTDPGGYVTVHLLEGVEGVPAMPGRWFNDASGVAKHTSFAHEPLTFSTLAPSLFDEKTEWRIGVTAREWSGNPLPIGYESFEIGVRVNGAQLGVLRIPASSTEGRTGWLDVGMLPPEASVSLTWLNKPASIRARDHRIGISAVQFAASSVPGPGTLAATGAVAMLTLVRRRNAVV